MQKVASPLVFTTSGFETRSRACVMQSSGGRAPNLGIMQQRLSQEGSDARGDLLPRGLCVDYVVFFSCCAEKPALSLSLRQIETVK